MTGERMRANLSNGTLTRAAATTSLKVDWGILAFEGGVGGEDADEDREGVHLRV